MKAIKLRTEQKVNPIGIDGKEQFLSWICEDGISQSAYQIKACTGDQTIYDSGKVASQDMHHLLELNLESRQRVCGRCVCGMKKTKPENGVKRLILKWVS